MSNIQMINVTNTPHMDAEILRLYNKMPHVPNIGMRGLSDMFKNETIWALSDVDKPNELVGLIAFEHIEDKGRVFIHALIIDDAYRNKGYGRTILTIMKQKFPTQVLYLLTSIENTIAHQFYEREGFIRQSEVQARYNRCYLYTYK